MNDPYIGLRLRALREEQAHYDCVADNAARLRKPAAAMGAAAMAMPATSTAKHTDIDLSIARHRAREEGIAAERARWSAVFKSASSQGRERGAANALAMSQGFTSAAIIAELQALNPGIALAAGGPVAAKVDPGWKRAIAKANRILDDQAAVTGRERSK
jgi:hypothetical protein